MMRDARSTNGARASWRRACALLLVSAFAFGCRPPQSAAASLRNTQQQTPPPALLGEFVDDYQGSYVISNTAWRHGTRLTYEIVAWYPDSQFVIARNAATNPREQGLWTRIDWMTLDGMPPYTWAYCLSAYKAPTQDSAMRTRVAKRDTPRTGCNGFPFSRMKRP